MYQDQDVVHIDGISLYKEGVKEKELSYAIFGSLSAADSSKMCSARDNMDSPFPTW